MMPEGRPVDCAFSPRGAMKLAMVRRLPVIQSRSPEDAEAEERPRSHWIAIGAGLMLAFWIPLAMLGIALGKRLSLAILGGAGDEAVAQATPGQRLAVMFAVVVPVLASFVLAALGAGALVGRFGGRSGSREAAVGGALGALGAWALAALGGSLGPWPVAVSTALVLVVLGAVSGGWGAHWGRQKRSHV
jgi:hypothetical protein